MEKFLTALFDFSFRKYITPSIVKFVYIIFVALSAIVTLGGILTGFTRGPLTGIVALLFAPLLFLAYVCVARLFLELVISVFRIANYSAELARASRRGQDPGVEPIADTFD